MSFLNNLTNTGGTITLRTGFRGVDCVVTDCGSQEVAANVLYYFAGQVTTNAVPLNVIIDIQPWDATNTVYPTSNEPIFVAIDSTRIADGDAVTFDATQVDPATLKFGIGEAQNQAVTPLVWDRDDDTDSDVIFPVKTQDTGILCGDTEATLTGLTYAGAPFTGTDSVTTTDCVQDCHP